MVLAGEGKSLWFAMPHLRRAPAVDDRSRHGGQRAKGPFFERSTVAVRQETGQGWLLYRSGMLR